MQRYTFSCQFCITSLLRLRDKFLCVYYTLQIAGSDSRLKTGSVECQKGLPNCSENFITISRLFFQHVGHVIIFLCKRVSLAAAQATIEWFLCPPLTLVCWKCDPIPIPDGEPGEGTGEVFGEEWRFPVISIMSWPMSFSSSSGKGRSNMSSRGRRSSNNVSAAPKNLNLIHPQRGVSSVKITI